MPSTRRWTVSTRRTVVSVVLGVLAVFMICASAGASSWVMAALGLAVLAAGVGLYVVSALNSREFAYVPGTANVQSCSPPPASALYGRCTMQLIVHAPGTDDVAVKIRETGVPVSKWPHEGSTLPILVAIGDRRRVRVLWDNVRSHADVADGLLGTDEPSEEPEVEDAYIGDLLDQDYQDPDEQPLAGVDPATRVIELDLMDPTVFRVSPADDDLDAIPDLVLPDPDDDLAADDQFPVAGTPVDEAPPGDAPPGDARSGDARSGDAAGREVPGEAPPAEEVPAARRPVDEQSRRDPLDDGPPIDAPLVDALWPPADAASAGRRPGGDGEAPGVQESPGSQESPGVRESPGIRESTGARPPAGGPPDAGRSDEPVRRPARRRPSPRPRRPVRDEMIESPGQGAVMTAEPPRITDPARTTELTFIPDPTDLGQAAAPTDFGTAVAPPTLGASATASPSAAPPSAAPPSAASAVVDDRDVVAGDPPATASPTASDAEAATTAAATTAAASAGERAATSRAATDRAATDRAAKDRVIDDRVVDDPVADGLRVDGLSVDGRIASAPATDGRPSGEPAASATTKAPPARPGTSLRVEHVLSAEPAVPAMPRSSVVGDLAEDGEISDAYLAVTPPPGQPEPSGVRGVGVTLFVSHLGRSVAFYRDTLGFIQVDMGLGSAVLESGDCRIELRRVIDMEPVDRRLIHLMLEVPDVHGAYEDLRSRGIEFVHRPRAVSRYDQLELWSAAFRDPDGHGIALIRWDLR